MKAPTFSYSFFQPKYWLNWIGLFILYLISWLPYKLQLFLGESLGLVIYRFYQRRVHIARTNIKICFPDKSAVEQEQLIRENFKATGVAFFESGIGWWWPTWRIKKLANIEGLDNLLAAKQSGQGVLIVAHHMVCMEICNRLLGLDHPNIGFYRPHNNSLMEYVQYKGRTRDNKYQIGKREIRNLYKALQENECVIYLPDQDYGKRKSVFVPFFAEPQACTTTGTSGIAKESNCKVITTIVYRNSDKSGYTIKLSPALDNYPTGDDEADATRINKLIETNIMYAPEQYMWLHRRFKTRPNSQDKGRIYQR